MLAGQVVLLNGVSSSGKSSIATELQDMLPGPFLKASIDTFTPMVPERLIAIDPPAGDLAERGMRVQTHDGPAGPSLILHPGDVFHRFVRGMHQAVAAMAREGNDIVFDDVIYEPAYFRSYLDAFEEVSVWFVGVKIPLHVAERTGRAARVRCQPRTAANLMAAVLIKPIARLGRLERRTVGDRDQREDD